MAGSPLPRHGIPSTEAELSKLYLVVSSEFYESVVCYPSTCCQEKEKVTSYCLQSWEKKVKSECFPKSFNILLECIALECCTQHVDQLVSKTLLSLPRQMHAYGL